jgi:hypothetical protein
MGGINWIDDPVCKFRNDQSECNALKDDFKTIFA